MAQSFKVNVVGGCGHVGLPLAIALADKGHRVCIHDINQASMNTIRGGTMPFMEAGGEPLLKKALASGNLTLSGDPASISDAEIVVFIIGTPVDEHLNPKFDIIKRSLDELLPHFRDGQVMVLRSTVFPGISEKVQRYFRSNRRDVHVTFCPERIAEGHALEEFSSLPQIISGFSDFGEDRARALFACLDSELVNLQPLEAELAKLFTNAYRYIKFSIANQFYQIATDYGLDFHRIHHAMTHQYPRAADFPRPGFAAGPCLFKDTMQLAAFNNNNFFLGHAAMLINEGLPNYVVQKLKESVPLWDRKVGILGMAFKANSDDKRESLSYKLRKILEIEAAEVLCSDVYIQEPGFISANELINRADVIILGVPHREYKKIETRGKRVIDVWNFLT